MALLHLSRLLFAGLLACSTPGTAAPRFALAEVITHTNDFFVDGQDRWRTASVSASLLNGPVFTGQAPAGFGELVEIRTRFEMISPADLSQPGSGNDRPYVGAISLGVFSHQQRDELEISAGAELVILGPSTGVSQIQNWLHARMAPIHAAILAEQLADAVHPTVNIELARTVALTPGFHIRPFAEGQVGVETYIRTGIDLTFSARPLQEFRVREVVTGQRLPALHMPNAQQWGFGLGGDITYIANSAYFGESGHPGFTPWRTRLRAGGFYQGNRLDAFYGISWHSAEFIGQPEGQAVATISVSLRF